METRRLQHTNLIVSRVCLGTMTFGGQTDEATAFEMIGACLDHGVNFFDTANVYQAGVSETIVGKALKGRRDRVVLASKCAAKTGPAPDQAGLSRAAILRAAEDSLQRLQTDYLDLYYLHWPDYTVPLEESLAAMDELVRAGKVRHVAASNFASWQICRLHWLAETRRLPRVSVTQPMYNLLARGIEQEFLPMCQQLGVSTIVYNPLAGGLLTGKQKFEAPLPGTRFDKNQMYLDRYWHEANFVAVQELNAIAAAAHRSLVSLALNWVLHHTPVDSLILGASKPAHLQENLRAVDEGPLSPETVAGLDRVWARLRGPSPKYNR
ncbi:MAG: aldo/keto reductase [Verrucomicrobia bacterium]|nr:aldo/keto reductase [Verrucomicrobiota bacterium]